MANAASLAKHIAGYFTVDEVKSLGDENVFTIKAAGLKEVGQGAQAEEKPVLTFVETKKGLVLSKGRCNQLGALFGDEDVEGKKIGLGVESIKGREQVVVLSAE